MNKKQAKIEAENNTRTYGELLALVRRTRGKRGMSIVNKSLTLDQVLDIHEAWLSEKDQSTMPKTMHYDISRGREVLTALGVMNVLRECA